MIKSKFIFFVIAIIVTLNDYGANTFTLRTDITEDGVTQEIVQDSLLTDAAITADSENDKSGDPTDISDKSEEGEFHDSAESEEDESDDSTESEETGSGEAENKRNVSEDKVLPTFQWETNATIFAPHKLIIDFHDGNEPDVAILFPKIYDGEEEACILSGSLRDELDVDVAVNGCPSSENFSITMASSRYPGGFFQVKDGITQEIGQDPSFSDVVVPNLLEYSDSEVVEEQHLPSFQWLMTMTSSVNETNSPFKLTVDFHDGNLPDVAILNPRVYDGEEEPCILYGTLENETDVEVAVNGCPLSDNFNVVMRSNRYPGGVFLVKDGMTKEIGQAPDLTDVVIPAEYEDDESDEDEHESDETEDEIPPEEERSGRQSNYFYDTVDLYKK